MTAGEQKWFKYVIIFAGCFLFRILPWRAPNLEPILAALMPISRIFGKLSAFLFAFSSIFFYDLSTSGIGPWTWVAGLVYGFVGVWSARYFKNRLNTKGDYAKFAIISTLLFDMVTGFSIGPIFFHQPLWSAMVGQIPFTALHLLGNISFAVLLSPIIYKYLAREKKYTLRTELNLEII